MGMRIILVVFGSLGSHLIRFLGSKLVMTFLRYTTRGKKRCNNDERQPVLQCGDVSKSIKRSRGAIASRCISSETHLDVSTQNVISRETGRYVGTEILQKSPRKGPEFGL